MVNETPIKQYVMKRDGKPQEVHLDKITSRIEKLCEGLNMDFIEPVAITLKVVQQLYPGVTTVELDTLTAEIAATMTTTHPDYGLLAARIAVSNLHKRTKEKFTDVVDDLYNRIQKKTGRKIPRISDFHYKIIKDNADRLNAAIDFNRDYNYDYFGFKTLEQSYLWRIDGEIIERPQHMLMRVAVGIHGNDMEKVIETYELLSRRYFTHSSPTLYSAAAPKSQLSPSYLVMMPDDSIEGIFNCIRKCVYISKFTGEIGLNVHNIRAKGTYIAGTNGISNGLVPMLRVFNNAAHYVEQAGNLQPGAFAVYLEPWHADIFDFLNLNKPTGKDEVRARELSFALWIPDLFMKRVEKNGNWSLMCPHMSPGLSDCWGKEFEKLYEKYESEGRFKKQVEARKLWNAIVALQMETGIPYMLYKDSCNRMSNQQNLGTIKSGNFSTEIIEYTSSDEVAVCNSASIALDKFVDVEKKTYDFNKLKEVSKVVTKNLNKIIDVNYYPVPEAKTSNLKHRPIGIGVQGLADAFILLRVPFDSAEALLLNKQIFETIYYGALEASSELAEIEGTYSTHKGSPVSKGILQYDMWNVTPTNLWDWSILKEKIAKYGVRNSLLVAPTSTDSTAQILGNNESFEPYTSNVQIRRGLSGEFSIVNHHLLKELTQMNLWNDVMKNQLISNFGSIQNIPNIPDELKNIYKTVWEISQKVLLNMAADRGAFIDQSQCINIYLEKPTYGVLTSIHYYAWKKGLKTGMYYLRTKPSSTPVQFAVDKQKLSVKNEERDEVSSSQNGNGVKNEEDDEELARLVCSLQNPGACDMCGA